MNSPETIADKEPVNKCMVMLLAAQMLIAATAVGFAVENSNEINNFPTQSVGHQNFANEHNR